MAENISQFVWYELVTTDATAALDFYKAVIGWTSMDSGLSDRQYNILHAGDTPMGGVFALPPEVLAAGARPCWMGYIGVDDVDATVARITAAGGGTHRAAEDIPGVGRFAIVADPQGAAFVLFTPATSTGRPEPTPAGTTPGRIGWHELQAGAWESAFAFYADQFGWTKDRAIDMGPMGTYQLFATGGEAVGGMMTKMPDRPVPFWVYYINVESVAAAIVRTEEHGGTLMHGPQEVPGGSWIAVCGDPQGAVFAMVSPGP